MGLGGVLTPAQKTGSITPHRIFSVLAVRGDREQVAGPKGSCPGFLSFSLLSLAPNLFFLLASEIHNIHMFPELQFYVIHFVYKIIGRFKENFKIKY